MMLVSILIVLLFIVSSVNPALADPSSFEEEDKQRKDEKNDSFLTDPAVNNEINEEKVANDQKSNNKEEKTQNNQDSLEKDKDDSEDEKEKYQSTYNTELASGIQAYASASISSQVAISDTDELTDAEKDIVAKSLVIFAEKPYVLAELKVQALEEKDEFIMFLSEHSSESFERINSLYYDILSSLLFANSEQAIEESETVVYRYTINEGERYFIFENGDFLGSTNLMDNDIEQVPLPLSNAEMQILPPNQMMRVGMSGEIVPFGGGGSFSCLSEALNNVGDWLEDHPTVADALRGILNGAGYIIQEYPIATILTTINMIKAGVAIAGSLAAWCIAHPFITAVAYDTLTNAIIQWCNNNCPDSPFTVSSVAVSQATGQPLVTAMLYNNANTQSAAIQAQSAISIAATAGLQGSMGSAPLSK